jgi:hypothetical protein
MSTARHAVRAVRGQTTVALRHCEQHTRPLGGTRADAGQAGGLRGGQEWLVARCCPRVSGCNGVFGREGAACVRAAQHHTPGRRRHPHAGKGRRKMARPRWTLAPRRCFPHPPGQCALTHTHVASLRGVATTRRAPSATPCDRPHTRSHYMGTCMLCHICNTNSAITA